jgi:Zn finger protein HypA/HybF involved in hydrogenase expression
MAFDTLTRSLCLCHNCNETLEVRDWSDYCPACHAKGQLMLVEERDE